MLAVTGTPIINGVLGLARLKATSLGLLDRAAELESLKQSVKHDQLVSLKSNYSLFDWRAPHIQPYAGLRGEIR